MAFYFKSYPFTRSSNDFASHGAVPAAGNAPATYPSAAENAITLTVNDATFDAWNKAATAEGKLLRQWCVDVINESLE